MNYCQINLYQSIVGISGDVHFPNGSFGTGCLGSDSQDFVDWLCRKMNRSEDVTVNVVSRPYGLRKRDQPLGRETLAEIKQLLRDKNYNVK